MAPPFIIPHKEIMQGTTTGEEDHARKTTHGLDGQHQDMDRTARGKVNRGRLKNRTEQNSLLMFN